MNFTTYKSISLSNNLINQSPVFTGDLIPEKILIVVIFLSLRKCAKNFVDGGARFEPCTYFG